LRITQQKSIEKQIKRIKGNWIGHTLRRERGAIEKTALSWNPQGYRRRGRPKRTWRRTIEDEIRGIGRSWNEVKGIAGDRKAWNVRPQGVTGRYSVPTGALITQTAKTLTSLYYK
jgi:hypothetical protein